MRSNMDEPTRHELITAKAKELLFPNVHNDIMERFRKLGPAPVYWNADSEPRQFIEEVITVGKYKYIGEWDPTTNTPHGFGFWMKNNFKSLVQCYCKQGLHVGFGREYFMTPTGQVVVYQGEF
jgi:hypothetical protein